MWADTLVLDVVWVLILVENGHELLIQDLSLGLSIRVCDPFRRFQRSYTSVIATFAVDKTPETLGIGLRFWANNICKVVVVGFFTFCSASLS